jgi:CheY-like chemotaxis protein
MEPTKETKKHVPQMSIELDPDDRLAGLRILIVEDMGLVAMELQLMLEKLDCHIVGVASRLSEAKELAQTTECLDGVLLDLNLSGRNSYPVAEILHERGIPFIIMSGYDTSHIRVDCASDAHLQKPFSHDDLARIMLRTFISGDAA